MIDVGKTCKTCLSRCLFVSKSCVMDSLIRYETKHIDLLERYIDKAQQYYIKPHIGTECLTEIPIRVLLLMIVK
jgi:hypothetical protein